MTLFCKGGMVMKRKQLLLCAFIIAMLMTVTAGCQQQAKKPDTTSQKPASPAQVTESDKRIMANKFSEIAKDVPGVTNATVVVAAAEAALDKNPDASKTSTSATSKLSTASPSRMVVMVGLTLNAQSRATSAKQESVKKTVKQKIKSNDKRITDVLVTTDANMVKKINDVASGLIQGKPVVSYARSAAELGKMMKEQMK